MFIPTPKTHQAKNGSRLIVVPPIPLERPEHKKVPKTSYVTFKLRTNPSETDSPEYDLSIQYFKSGTAEELLTCLKNIKKVFVEMNIKTGPTQYAMVRRILQGDALSAFDLAAGSHGTETVDNIKKCFESLKKHVFPVNAYQRQRHFMNRVMRKPKDWMIRQFTTRVTELNEYLAHFPDPSASVKAKKFADVEITDIAANAIPNSWLKAMAYHNFDPLIHTPNEFTSFCERIEHVETMGNLSEKNSHNEPSAVATGKVQSRSRKGKRKSRDEEFSGKTGKWCVLHNTDTHDTNECKTLLAQAKKMRAAWETNGVAKGSSTTHHKNKGDSSKNVSWKKSTNENYAFELGKMMMSLMKENPLPVDNGYKPPKTNTNSEESDDDHDNDVVMGEHYNLDAIDKFVGNEVEVVEVDADTKKKSQGGSD